jgi:serine/threonine protein phosphatase PrpC
VSSVGSSTHFMCVLIVFLFGLMCRFMVVASDGVWEFLSSEDVVEIVKGCAGDADRVRCFSNLSEKVFAWIWLC